MPLRDHFRPPPDDELHWESFHSAWANTLVRHLNLRWLPARYRAQPQAHLGTVLEIDDATFEREAAGGPGIGAGNGGGTATAVWAPPRPTQSFAVDFPAQDLFEV